MFETRKKLRRQRDDARDRADRIHHNAEYEWQKQEGKIVSMWHDALSKAAEIEGLKAQVILVVAERDLMVTKHNELWQLVRNLRGEENGVLSDHRN